MSQKTDYLELHENREFQSLFEPGGLLAEKIAQCRRLLLYGSFPGPYEFGRIQGQLQALEGVEEAVKKLAAKQVSDAAGEPTGTGKRRVGPVFLRPVP